MTEKEWSNITRIKCYPKESDSAFFCEVHHHTRAGSTLDAFETERLYFEGDVLERGALATYTHDYELEPAYKGEPVEIVFTIIFKNKDGYCREIESWEYGEEIETVKCGKKLTFGELYEGKE